MKYKIRIQFIEAFNLYSLILFSLLQFIKLSVWCLESLFLIIGKSMCLKKYKVLPQDQTKAHSFPLVKGKEVCKLTYLGKVRPGNHGHTKTKSQSI